ncbi:unnamed protein product [Rotaria sp. Silwood2]|nr:unnamed protein product [Rotaria sp. Silwood2]CAF2722670.1 unnamed protein product [Rotaria sp. Silwood2]CAF3103189.1 unnamed protein product [Rotaria sp. Silwood2]CAF4095412.1 unnamed protein product [Rotaria sp. Silwood2]CAF4140850.1 unnamed protein product [Rotaria sp. Silwood2]
MQNNKLLTIEQYQRDRTINWLLETNRNNSYLPSSRSLRYSSSSSLSLLEKQCLRSKQQRKRKQITNNRNMSDNDSMSSLSTTVIIERNRQVLSDTICNTVDIFDEHIHNLDYIQYQKKSLLSRISASSNKHQTSLIKVHII